MMVCVLWSPSWSIYSTQYLTMHFFSTLYSSPHRPSLSCTGVGSPISSAASRSSSLAFSAYRYLCSVLGSQLLIGVLLCGTYSFLIIGPTTSYYISRRGLNGALNGNVGVIKSIIAEITDPTNAPQVFAYIPITWSVGGALGYVWTSFLASQ